MKVVTVFSVLALSATSIFNVLAGGAPAKAPSMDEYVRHGVFEAHHDEVMIMREKLKYFNRAVNTCAGGHLHECIANMMFSVFAEMKKVRSLNDKCKAAYKDIANRLVTFAISGSTTPQGYLILNRLWRVMEKRRVDGVLMFMSSGQTTDVLDRRTALRALAIGLYRFFAAGAQLKTPEQRKIWRDTFKSVNEIRDITTPQRLRPISIPHFFNYYCDNHHRAQDALASIALVQVADSLLMRYDAHSIKELIQIYKRINEEMLINSVNILKIDATPIASIIDNCREYRLGAGRDAKKSAKRPHAFCYSTFQDTI